MAYSTKQARYETAIAVAHRAVHRAQQAALALELELGADELTCILATLTHLGKDALKGNKYASQQMAGQEPLPF